MGIGGKLVCGGSGSQLGGAPAPTPALTPLTQPTADACQPWCEFIAGEPWSKRCQWKECRGCGSCPTPAPELCEVWCDGHSSDNSEKCGWNSCHGCSFCPMPPSSMCEYWCPGH